MGLTSPTALDKLAEITENDNVQGGNIVVCGSMSWANGFETSGWRFKHQGGRPGVAIIGTTYLNGAALLEGAEQNVRRIACNEYSQAIQPFDVSFDGLREGARRQAYFYNDDSREKFRSELLINLFG